MTIVSDYPWQEFVLQYDNIAHIYTLQRISNWWHWNYPFRNELMSCV